MSKFLFCNQVQFKATTNLQFVKGEHKRERLKFFHKDTVFDFVARGVLVVGGNDTKDDASHGHGSLLTGRGGGAEGGKV